VVFGRRSIYGGVGIRGGDVSKTHDAYTGCVCGTRRGAKPQMESIEKYSSTEA